MAHSLSAKKRIRQNAKQRIRNRACKSAVKTQIGHFLETAKSGKELASIESELLTAQKKIDKLASKGIMHRNTAARRKSQLARQYKAAQSRLGSASAV